MSTTAHAPIALSVYRLIGFSAPGLATGLMGGAVVSILPTVYVSQFGVDMVFVGFVLMVARIFDAITDPVIGYMSDRTTLRFGRRRSWILPGTLLLSVAAFSLMRPPEHPGNIYFFAVYLLFYLAGTMIEIPLSAWSAELSRDPGQRTRIVTYRNLVASAGTLLFAVTPILLGQGNAGFTPEVLSTLGIIMLCLIPVLGIVSINAVTENPINRSRAMESPIAVLRDVWANRPYRMFIGIFLIAGMGFGMYGGLYFLYVQTYLGIGDAISVIMILMLSMGFIALPLWMRIIQRIGKRRAWALGLCLVSICSVAMALIVPGPNAKMQFITILVIMGLCSGYNSIVPFAMQADIVDYDTLKSGRDRAGSYYALLMLILKVNFALGAGLGFVILGAIGYDANAATHSDAAIIALKLCTFVVPALFMALAALWVLRFPLTERHNAIIKRRLESRQRVAALQEQS